MEVKYKIKARPSSVNNLREVSVLSGFDTPDMLSKELEEMFSILLARVDSPVDGPIALMEVADAFYARASEIKFFIHRGERTGDIDGSRASKDPYHVFRTGELEDFLDACKRASELGSRRLSAQQLEYEQNVRGLESA